MYVNDRWDYILMQNCGSDSSYNIAGRMTLAKDEEECYDAWLKGKNCGDSSDEGDMQMLVEPIAPPPYWNPGSVQDARGMRT